MNNYIIAGDTYINYKFISSIEKTEFDVEKVAQDICDSIYSDESFEDKLKECKNEYTDWEEKYRIKIRMNNGDESILKYLEEEERDRDFGVILKMK